MYLGRLVHDTSVLSLSLSLPPPSPFSHSLTLMHNLYTHSVHQGTSFKNQPLNAAWREKYTRQLISSLSASRLAKSICAQFRARVTASHETFLSAIKQLETRHSGRLKSSEEQRATIRKVLTPKMAKLSLSSVALRDRIVHGLPVTGKCAHIIYICTYTCTCTLYNCTYMYMYALNIVLFVHVSFTCRCTSSTCGLKHACTQVTRIYPV